MLRRRMSFEAGVERFPEALSVRPIETGGLLRRADEHLLKTDNGDSYRRWGMS